MPTNKNEMKERGWVQADFVYISGDAYVDHPSFGMAIITRLLENAGYKVAVIAQPDWKDDASITVCGEPRTGFSRVGGQHGFHGQSLYFRQKKTASGCLHAGRRIYPEGRTGR